MDEKVIKKGYIGIAPYEGPRGCIAISTHVYNDPLMIDINSYQIIEIEFESEE